MPFISGGGGVGFTKPSQWTIGAGGQLAIDVSASSDTTTPLLSVKQDNAGAFAGTLFTVQSFGSIDVEGLEGNSGNVYVHNNADGNNITLDTSHGESLNRVGLATAVIQSGALPTQQFVTTVGAQILTARDVDTVTPFTGDGTNNVASCVVALSPDNVTYSTVDTLSIAAALNLTGTLALAVNLRVPAGWYLKLTSSHGTIGVTSYY